MTHIYTKLEKETNILYNQTTDPIEICGYDQKLFRKLKKFAKEYPDLCQCTKHNEETDYYEFLLEKECLSVRFNRPMSEEKRNAARARAQANGLGGKAER